MTPIPDWRPRLPVEIERRLGKTHFVDATEVKRLMEQTGMDLSTLLQAFVVPAAALAKPLLSGFYVGAAGLAGSGSVYFGGNIEFPGGVLANSVHAEQCLLANLLRHREQKLVAIAISAPPCGHCRQVFSELSCADEVEIIFGPGPHNKYKLPQLLPHRFGPQDLLEDKNQPLLLQDQRHDLDFTSTAREILDKRKQDASFQAAAAAALAAARQCYTPYTGTAAAVALLSAAAGPPPAAARIHVGAIIENAAHNPTLQPLQAAFANALFDGLQHFDKVEEAILVEIETAALRQEKPTRVLLSAVSPQAILTVLQVRRN